MSKKKPLSLENRVTAGDQHVSCDVSGELIMLSLETGEYYGMNPVAARIWSLIQSETTIASVRDQMMEEYEDVTSERCTEDLLDVLTQLADWGVVEVK